MEVFMDYKLRKCTFDDLDFILDLKTLGMKWYIEKLYGWDLEKQKQLTLHELEENLGGMNVIVVDGKDVGITTLIETKDYYEVGLIIVHPDYQNKGIASKIISEYINFANNNEKRIVIKTYKGNPAQRLYLKLGFQIYKTDETHIYFEINFNN